MMIYVCRMCSLTTRMCSSSKDVMCSKHMIHASAYTPLDRCQKRPTLVSKETYTSVKRDLH
jgi:hypothetical protein